METTLPPTATPASNAATSIPKYIGALGGVGAAAGREFIFLLASGYSIWSLQENDVTAHGYLEAVRGGTRHPPNDGITATRVKQTEDRGW